MRRRAASRALCTHICPIPRRPSLAFGTKAAPSSKSPIPNLPPPPPLQTLTAPERLLEVVIATSSNLLNGAIFGGLFGLVSGLWSTRSLRGALAEAKGNGRSWAAISAVYAGLQTASKVIRNREDRFNAVVGACGSGAAFSMKGGPRAAAQGCVSFAALSYLIDALTAPKEDPQSDEAILRKKP